MLNQVQVQVQILAAVDQAAGDRAAEAASAAFDARAFLEVRASAMRSTGHHTASELIQPLTWAGLPRTPTLRPAQANPEPACTPASSKAPTAPCAPSSLA